jgi:hypothetical protein
MERNKRKIGRWLGVLTAVLVPAIATAALTIPNTFTAGTVIKSADVNANFAAVATAVTADQTAVASLQTTVASLQTSVASLQATVTSQATTITSLQTTVSSLSSTIAASPQIVGFAFVEASSVVSFGGAGTTSAVASYGYTGYMELTFTGKYPSSINVNRVMIVGTPWEYNYGSMDAGVISATPTSITIAVYSWVSSSQAAHDNYFYVALIAQP